MHSSLDNRYLVQCVCMCAWYIYIRSPFIVNFHDTRLCGIHSTDTLLLGHPLPANLACDQNLTSNIHLAVKSPAFTGVIRHTTQRARACVCVSVIPANCTRVHLPVREIVSYIAICGCIRALRTKYTRLYHTVL